MTKTSRKRRLPGSSSDHFPPIFFHLSSAVSSCRHAHTPKFCQSHQKLFWCPDCNCRRLAHGAKEDSLLRDMSQVCCAPPCLTFHLTMYAFQTFSSFPLPGVQPFKHNPSSRSRDTYCLILTLRLAPPQPTQGTHWLEHALITVSAT